MTAQLALVEKAPLAHVHDPRGILEPQHVGQFFFDMQNEVFYQAIGLGAHDWRFVPPHKLQSAFVRTFVDFLEPRHHGQKYTVEEREAIRRERAARGPHILADGALAAAGVRTADARCWTAHGGERVAQIRLRVETRGPVSVFFGLCSGAPSQVHLAAYRDTVFDKRGAGFLLDDNGCAFVASGEMTSSKSAIWFRPSYLAFRIEIVGDTAQFWIGDRKVCELPFSGSAASLRPRLTLFLKEL